VHHYEEKMPRENSRMDRDDRRRGDFRDRRPNISPRRSPVYKHRSRSISPRNYNLHERKRDYDVDLRHLRPQNRSPPYNQMYHRSPTPQRLTTDSIAKDSSIFCGPEGTVIDLNELKKITVDIRRNLPRGVAGSHGPLRFVFNPSDIVIVRRPGEGSRPIFDREELKPRSIEERVIKLATNQVDPMDHPSPISPPAMGPSVGFHNYQIEGDSESDLRYRLMEKKNNEDIKERMNADPNFVPQGRYYYEHDNRERFNRGRGRFMRDSHRGNHHRGGYNGGGHRGNYRGDRGGRGRGGHGESFRGSFRGKQRSPDWKHDMYDTVDDAKPSSTTPI